MNRFENISNYFIENAASLAMERVDYAIGQLEVQLPKEIIEKALLYNKRFFEFFGETLILEDDKVTAEYKLWLEKYGEAKESLMGKISSLIQPYANTRKMLIKRITHIATEHALTVDELVYVSIRINYLLDMSITETIVAHEKYTDSINKKTRKELIELSCPVVPIQDGLAILPLIGTVGFDRAEHLMNKVVPKIGQMKIKCLILDFSGIVTINAEVASHIFMINNVLRLLGIGVMVTGIRPDLAQKVVSAGIDFSSIRTYANVHKAIRSVEKTNSNY